MSETTLKQHLIIPEVIADMVESAFGAKSALLPLATLDRTLMGVPGDTLKFPAFRYIGKAEEVAENGEVSPGILSADTVPVTVKKYAKAVRVTDEARLSGFGDPLGEAARQLARAIDHAVDDALFERLQLHQFHQFPLVADRAAHAGHVDDPQRPLEASGHSAHLSDEKAHQRAPYAPELQFPGQALPQDVHRIALGIEFNGAC